MSELIAKADTNTEALASLAPRSSKLDQVKGQVNEVEVILEDNINKLLERGDRLDDQTGKTDEMQASDQQMHLQAQQTPDPPVIMKQPDCKLKKESESFLKTSARLGLKYCSVIIKLIIIIGLIGVIFILLIISRYLNPVPL